MITTLILALLQEYPYAYFPSFKILKNIYMENSPISLSLVRMTHEVAASIRRTVQRTKRVEVALFGHRPCLASASKCILGCPYMLRCSFSQPETHQRWSNARPNEAVDAEAKWKSDVPSMPNTNPNRSIFYRWEPTRGWMRQFHCRGKASVMRAVHTGTRTNRSTYFFWLLFALLPMDPLPQSGASTILLELRQLRNVSTLYIVFFHLTLAHFYLSCDVSIFDGSVRATH